MSGRNADAWLEQWVEENLHTPQYIEEKSEVRDQACQCAEDAEGVGFTIPDIKEAAGGDLEEYLMVAQNAFTDAEVERKSAED